MTIERACEGDAEELDGIIAKDFPYKHFTKESILQRIGREGLAVFKKRLGKDLAGFIEIEITGKIGMVNAISVKPEHRKKGIGRELLDHAVEYLRGRNVERARLLVKHENSTAKKLYEACGFSFARLHEKKIEGSTIEIWEKRLLSEESADYLN